MSSCKILMVEDDSSLRKVWMMLLSNEGYQVIPCADASDALKVLDSGLVPDVFMTDYFIPDSNGVSLIDEVQQRIKGIPCLLITGSQEQMVFDEVKARDNVFLINKPVMLHDLKLKLQNLSINRKVS